MPSAGSNAASTLVPLLDRRSAACVLAMAGAYRRLLEHIAAAPAIVLRGAPVAATLGEGLGARAQPRAERRMSGARVAVVGGGLAGIAAALELADNGADVTLFEARSRLGGATYSVQRNDHWIDNGQHVALCAAAPPTADFSRGSASSTSCRSSRACASRSCARESLLHSCTALRLPAPLHLVPTLLRYAPLDRRERAGALRAAAALRKLDPEDPSLDAARRSATGCAPTASRRRRSPSSGT